MRLLFLPALKLVLMVDSLVRYMFSPLLFSLFFTTAVSAGPLSADSVLVFRKMPADTVVAPSDVNMNSARKSSAPRKKGVPVKNRKKSAAVKKKAAKPLKKAYDSLHYAEKKIYLGDRVIMRGDSGADVKKLAEIMVKNLYMDEKDVVYTKSGAVLYDGELVKAVRLFQRASGLYGDGIVGETTIKALRKVHRWRRSSQ